MLAVKLDSFNSSTNDKEAAKAIGYDASKYNYELNLNLLLRKNGR